MIEHGTVQPPADQGGLVKAKSLGAPGGEPAGISVTIPGTKTALIGALGAFIGSLASPATWSGIAQLINAIRGCTP